MAGTPRRSRRGGIEPGLSTTAAPLGFRPRFSAWPSFLSAWPSFLSAWPSCFDLAALFFFSFAPPLLRSKSSARVALAVAPPLLRSKSSARVALAAAPPLLRSKSSARVASEAGSLMTSCGRPT